jgi:hypothetical protein
VRSASPLRRPRICNPGRLSRPAVFVATVAPSLLEVPSSPAKITAVLIWRGVGSPSRNHVGQLVVAIHAGGGYDQQTNLDDGRLNRSPHQAVRIKIGGSERR